jgi:hypothetical protein
VGNGRCGHARGGQRAAGDDRRDLATSWVFVHVPKNGGTSIRQALLRSFGSEYFGTAGAKNPHCRARDYREVLGHDVWSSAFRFAVVRHPLDRLVSAWAYAFTPAFEGVAGFRRWVEAGFPLHDRYHLRLSSGRRVWMHAPQVEWVGVGHMDVDLLIRFEALDQGWAAVASRIGADPQLGHDNRSERLDTSEYYDTQTRRLAVARYAADFEQLGYEE